MLRLIQIARYGLVSFLLHYNLSIYSLKLGVFNDITGWIQTRKNILNITGNMIMQVHIAQRGAITPLIKMLESSDEQVVEMSAFALGRLAQVFMFLN